MLTASDIAGRALGVRGAARRWESLIETRAPHTRQQEFINSRAKRKVIRAGRRGGKTTGIAIAALLAFMDGKRVLYTAPTGEQVGAFWYEVKIACQRAIDAGALYKNETEHIIEVPGTKNRIRAKTAWNADTLRGDYGDLLIFDEYQLMSEDAWATVGAPMLIDNNGDAVFIYTPPSLHSRSATKANDPRHAAKLFKQAQADETGRWATFHFSSYENPHVSKEAVDQLAGDMTAYAFAQEILAEDKDESPGALWNHDTLDGLRVNTMPELKRVIVGVDPPGGATECGIVVAALGANGHGYILDDSSLQGSPGEWADAVVAAYNRHRADRIVGEKNYGGDMVEHTIRTTNGGRDIAYQNVQATRGKALRAEPIAALYEQGRVHHVGLFPALEDELCSWEPDRGMSSPNRLDAMVWALTELMLGVEPSPPRFGHVEGLGAYRG